MENVFHTIQPGKKMNKRITIKDVARAADCSFVAVSRVLSGRDLNHVSLDVQKRVRDAAERLGYKPSQAARALRTGRTNTIGLVLGAFYNRMEGCVAHALMADAKKRGYRLIIAITNYDPQEEAGALEDILNRQVDGVIYTLSLDPGTRLARSLGESRYPILLQDNTQNMFNSVWYDYDEALQGVFASFRNHGCRKVAMICSIFNGQVDYRRKLARHYGIALECFTHGDGDHSLEAVYAEIVRNKIPGVFALESMVLKNLLEYRAAASPDYHPACIYAHTLPFEYLHYDGVLGAVYRPFRALSEQRLKRLIEMIGNPRTRCRSIQMPCRFVDVAELKRIHEDQMNDPYYQYFK